MKTSILFILLLITAAVPLAMDIRLLSVFDLSKITVLIIGVAISLSLWAYHSLCYKSNTPKNPLAIPALSILGASLISTVLSISPYMSLVGTYKRYGGFISMAAYIGLFFLVVQFTQRKHIRHFISVIIGVGTVTAAYGIFQYYNTDFDLWTNTWGRSWSTLGHPVFFAAFMVMVIPLALSRIFSTANKRWAAAYMVIVAIMLFGFYTAKTRGAFIGLTVSMIFSGVVMGRSLIKKTPIRALVIVLVIIGAVVYFNVGREDSILKRFKADFSIGVMKKTPARLSGSAESRYHQYLMSLKIAKDYPVLGVGPDTLTLVYAKYFKEYGRGYAGQNRIHNSVLHRLVTVGAVGLIVWLWFLVAYGRTVYRRQVELSGLRNYNTTQGSWVKLNNDIWHEKLLVAGLATGILAYIVQNQFSFGHIPITTTFWVMVGLSVVACREEDIIWHRLGKRKSLTAFLTAVTIALSIGIVALSLCRYKADIYFEAGRRGIIHGKINEGIENYQKAVKWNPLRLEYWNMFNDVALGLAKIHILSKAPPESGELMCDGFTITSRINQRRFSEVIRGAKHIQRWYPNDYRSLFALARAYHFLSVSSNEKFGKLALRNYKKAIKYHPYRFILYDNIAYFYAQKRCYKDAIYYLKQAHELDKRRPSAYLNLIEMYIKAGMNKEAREVLVKVMAAHPKSEPDYKKYLQLLEGE